MFAAEIYDENARLLEAGHQPINLQSIILGKITSRRRAQCAYLLRRSQRTHKPEVVCEWSTSRA